MRLTDEQKRLNRIEAFYQYFRTLGIGKVFNQPKVGLAPLFQRLVRLANADSQGFCVCITCGVRKKWDQLDAGHYVSRENKRWILDPRNCHPQCVSCNQHQGGNRGEYRRVLVAKYGEEQVSEMERERLPKNHVWDKRELAEIKVNLKDEIKFHEKRIGV